MGGRSVEQAARQANSSDDDDDDDNTSTDTAGTSRSNRKRIQNLDWNKLGKMSTPNFKRTSSLTFMYVDCYNVSYYDIS